MQSTRVIFSGSLGAGALLLVEEVLAIVDKLGRKLSREKKLLL